MEETESFISDVARERPDRAIAGVGANEIDLFITNSKLAQRLAVRATAPHG